MSAYYINNTYIVVNKKEKTKVLLLGSINKIKETKSKLEKETKNTLIELKKKWKSPGATQRLQLKQT